MLPLCHLRILDEATLFCLCFALAKQTFLEAVWNSESVKWNIGFNQNLFLRPLGYLKILAESSVLSLPCFALAKQPFLEPACSFESIYWHRAPSSVFHTYKTSVFGSKSPLPLKDSGWNRARKPGIIYIGRIIKNKNSRLCFGLAKQTFFEVVCNFESE